MIQKENAINAHRDTIRALIAFFIFNYDTICHVPFRKQLKILNRIKAISCQFNLIKTVPYF